MSKTVTVTKIVRFDDESLDAFRSLAKLVRELAPVIREMENVLHELREAIALETIDEEYELPDETEPPIYFTA